jgi:hypothetical protein
VESWSVGTLGRRDRIALLDLFLRLVARAGATGSADSATDDGTGRTSDGPTHDRAGETAADRTRAGTGLLVTLGRLTSDRTGDGADAATDDGPDGATDGHADRSATQCAGTGPQGLLAALLVLGRRAGVMKVRVPADVGRVRVVDDGLVGQGISLVVHLVSYRAVGGRRRAGGSGDVVSPPCHDGTALDDPDASHDHASS